MTQHRLISQEVPQGLPRLVRQAWRDATLQLQVVVLVAQGPEDLASVPGQGRSIWFLEGEQVRETESAREGVEVLVVDQGREEDVEDVQEAGDCF